MSESEDVMKELIQKLDEIKISLDNVAEVGVNVNNMLVKLDTMGFEIRLSDDSIEKLGELINGRNDKEEK